MVRPIGNPRYDSGRTHPYHPNAPALNFSLQNRSGPVRRSPDRPLLHRHFARERETRLRGAAVEDSVREILSHRGTVLEAMARPSPNQPDVFPFRVPVDQEIAGRRVLVLADARLEERG